MDVFSKISEKVVSAGKSVGEKAKEVSDVAKLQYEIKGKEDFIDARYKEIGKKYYEEHPEEEFEDIVAALDSVKDLRKQIADIKGSATCPKCGASVPQGSEFCNQCGASMEDMFEEDEQEDNE